MAGTFNFSKKNYYVPQRTIIKNVFIYILKSLKDKSLYIGYTTNLKKRFIDHNNGLPIATKNKRPFQLIFYEAFLDRIDVKHRESYLKSRISLCFGDAL